MLINLRGVEVSGLWEIILISFNFFHLSLSSAGSFFLNRFFFIFLNPTPWYNVSDSRSCDVVGFFGLEAITTTAGSVHKPEVTLPKALA